MWMARIATVERDQNNLLVYAEAQGGTVGQARGFALLSLEGRAEWNYCEARSHSA